MSGTGCGPNLGYDSRKNKHESEREVQEAIRDKESLLVGMSVGQAFTNLRSLRNDYSIFLDCWVSIYSNNPDYKSYNPKEVKRKCDTLLEIYRKHEHPYMLELMKTIERKYPDMFPYICKNKMKTKKPKH